MLSARLNFFILEEIQGKYSKHFLSFEWQTGWKHETLFESNAFVTLN